MCTAGSLDCATQHSFSLTSAAVLKEETQDLQCSRSAQFTSSFIYHQTILIQSRCILYDFLVSFFSFKYKLERRWHYILWIELKIISISIFKGFVLSFLKVYWLIYCLYYDFWLVSINYLPKYNGYLSLRFFLLLVNWWLFSILSFKSKKYSSPFGVHMSSCGPPLFLWQKIENALFIRVFIYCEEMEKEGQRPSPQTVLGKKRNKASSQISSGVWAWQKRQMDVQDGLVCLLYLLEKKEHLAGFSPLFCNLTSSYSPFFVFFFSLSPLFFPNNIFFSSHSFNTPLPIYSHLSGVILCLLTIHCKLSDKHQMHFTANSLS